MRRETRFKLLRLKDQLLEMVPLIAIAAGIAGLVWAVFNWSETYNQYSRPAAEDDAPTPEEEISPQPEEETSEPS